LDLADGLVVYLVVRDATNLVPDLFD